MIECVPNVSEGRDPRVIDTLARACGAALLDVHHDADHHRAVFTLAGPGADGAIAAVRGLARAVAEQIDLRAHTGVHPRLGALDVVPFVPLGDGPAEWARARDAAMAFARWWAEEFGVPCFCYDRSRDGAPTLPQVRRDAFGALRPDFGPGAPHPRLGATAVGVRAPMVALNCVLRGTDLTVARAVAREVRESSGGRPGLRALGFPLERQGRVQVSMNLVALDRTGVEDAVAAVRAAARAAGDEVSAVELVGLVPAAEELRWSEGFRAWSGLGPDHTIEARLGRAAGRG